MFFNLSAPFTPSIDLDLKWKDILARHRKLFVATLQSREHSRSPVYFFRNRIVDLVSPAEIQTLRISFDFNELAKNKSNNITWHGLMIEKLVDILPENSICLLLDSDAMPLSESALKLSFVLADKFGVSGNAQRTNCIENNSHIFAGPSYLCFDTDYINILGKGLWLISERSDTGEEIFWRADYSSRENLFSPICTLMRPIWALDGNKPAYGIGTIFGYNNCPVSYHHFCSRVLIARLHFVIVSCLIWLRLTLKNLNLSGFFRFSFFKIFKSIALEIYLSLKYLFKGSIE